MYESKKWKEVSCTNSVSRVTRCGKFLEHAVQLMIFAPILNSSKRTCRCGAGKEVTLGAADTPGFELTDNICIKSERTTASKLLLDRNHPRLNQTAVDVLQSWRGNCDVQILIYDSHPDNPNIAEISKVTDYVVAYSCKGNHTLHEEKQQIRQLILASEEITGDGNDLVRVCRQALHKASVQRLIPKQEASVLLADLPLVSCSELIENVSISNGYRLKTTQQGDKTDTRLLDAYAKRDQDKYGSMSLHKFFFEHRKLHNKQPAIPHYIGVSGYPCFPVSKNYAKHVLVVYKPWTTYPSCEKWKEEFDDFINSRYCPISARMTYDRVLQRYLDKTTFAEPRSKDGDHSGNTISPEDEEMVRLIGISQTEFLDQDAYLLKSLKRGHDFDWGKPPKVNCYLRVGRKIEFPKIRFHVILTGTFCI